MGTRKKAKSDEKVAQGKRRDAYFAHLRRDAQPKASPKAEKTPEPTEA
jgi:hypothetical protein